MKKMAQRAMLRGNRGDAESITNFGVAGMRSNLQNQPQNVITQHVGTGNVVSNVNIQETKDNVKANIASAQVHHVAQSNNQPAKKLGQGIMDALN